MAKISSRNTYDIDGLKVTVIYGKEGYFEDTDQKDCSTLILKNGEKRDIIKIENTEISYNNRDGYGVQGPYIWGINAIVELLCIYNYLKNNEINHEILDEIKTVVIPEKNLNNERPNIDTYKLSQVYYQCEELKLTKEFNEEVKLTVENANNYYNENNKKLDRITKIKKVGAIAGKVALYTLASPLLIAALPFVIGAELADS